MADLRRWFPFNNLNAPLTSFLPKSYLKSSKLRSRILTTISTAIDAKFHPTPKQWIDLLQVCRYWRSCMMAHPTLWSTIPLNDASTFEECFHFFYALAGSLPSQIHTVSERTLPLVSRYTYRLRELHILCRPEADLSVFLREDAPLLECLDVAFESYYRSGSAAVPVLFNSSTPRLRRLVMEKTTCLGPPIRSRT